MKQTSVILLASLLSILMASPRAAAQSDGGWVDPASPVAGHRGFYVRNAIGANLLSSIKLEDRALGGDSVTDVRIGVDAGLAWQIDLGWQISDLLAVEVTSGVLYNEFDSISGTLNIGGNTESGEVPLGGSMLQVPFLVGPTFTFPLTSTPALDGGQSQLRLRLGGAVGGVYALGRLEGVDGLFTSGSDSNVTWAYSLTAALDWDLNSQMSLGVSYRFLGTGSSSFDAFGVPNLLETSGINNQLVMATFSIRF